MPGIGADIRVERASAAQLEEAAAIARDVFPAGNVARAFADPSTTLRRWRWLAEGAPVRWDDRMPAWVATMEGSVVGHFAVIPVIVAHQGRALRAAWARDLLVAARARGRGAGSRLVAQATRESGTVLVAGLNREVILLYRRVGYRERGRIPLYLKVLRPAELADAAGTGLRRWPIRALAEAAASYGGAPLRASDPPVAVVETLDERFDRWWARIEPAFGTVVRRSSAWMHWRYRGHPSHSYRLFVASDSAGLRGVAVTRRGTTRGVPAGFLVELLAHPRDHDAKRALVAAAVGDLGGSPELVLIRSNVLGGGVWRDLVTAGFVPAPSPFRWMIGPGSDASHELLDRARSWLLTSGDSDMDMI